MVYLNPTDRSVNSVYNSSQEKKLSGSRSNVNNRMRFRYTIMEEDNDYEDTSKWERGSLNT
jgi:hypothetical protein